MPGIRLVEISHDIPTFDAVQAAFLLRSVYAQFPPGTCHLLCVDTSFALYKQYLLAEHEGQYFMAPDNGAFSILFDEVPETLWRLPNPERGVEELFPEKNLFLPVLRDLREKGTEFLTPGKVRTNKQSWLPAEKEDMLTGTVMLIDRYQNAITNIHRDLLQSAGKGRPMQVFYSSRHYLDRVSRHFHEGTAGDEFILFNENGYLMIGMNRGKGAQLMGLKVGSRLVIEFEPQAR